MACSETTTRVLKLKTSDNEVVEVEEKAALQSEIIKGMVADGHSTDDAIPLFNVEKKTLTKIVEWLKKHASDASKDELHKWDADFLDVDTDSLYDLLRASNYLGIEVLLGQLIQKVADMIARNQHQPIKIRELFNIKNDFTPEEKEEILKENSWLI
ncbi:SKP1-like protein 11 [Populus alba x Populus x berolinensis]|nr:SKP1-like protein 11 [Populus alba x Populus x berolinensis]